MVRSSAVVYLASSLLWAVSAEKRAFVLLGATGDNAYRPAGVWSGLFEAWCHGIFQIDDGTKLHVQINKGHTLGQIQEKMMGVLQPFYQTLQADASWKCMLDNCSPETFYGQCSFNIWEGIGKYNASGQAENMSYLNAYDEIIPYMSVPPSAYKDWSDAMVKYWDVGGDKLHIAFEKPFGSGRDSLGNAISLHSNILASGIIADHVHLVDHWLSFFMNQNLPRFQTILQALLGVEWSNNDISKIVVTEYEERGFGGRGSFIDGLGQVRDMVQSHLLQVLTLSMIDPTSEDMNAAKLAILESFSLSSEKCELWQFDGLLESRWMKYHPSFADSTFCRVNLQSSLPHWKGVELVIQTGKAMDVNLYTVEVYQKDGSGVVTIDNGKEEVGTGDIKVAKWPLKNHNNFTAPLPGFKESMTTSFKPAVDGEGDGYILRYNDPRLYFPKPYAKMVNALVTGDFKDAFVTWPECKRSWELLTTTSPTICLDPPPQNVKIYIPAFLCDKEAPQICDQHETVEYKYDVKYSCTPGHDKWYADIDFYKSKCNMSESLVLAF